MDVQLALGSDILMVLDECTEYPATYERARESMELTVRWAQRAFSHYRGPRADREEQQALFPIVQGGMHRDLRRGCAESLLELNSYGYAIGGLSVGEPRPDSLAMVEETAPLLPSTKPRYVMGVGLPKELPEYVARGVDMMDCVLPSREARTGRLYTSEGRLTIKHARYKDDPLPPDPACGCYTCRNFSRAFLRHMFFANEATSYRLLTLHNLTYYLDLMTQARGAIASGRFCPFGYMGLLRHRD